MMVKMVITVGMNILVALVLEMVRMAMIAKVVVMIVVMRTEDELLLERLFSANCR